jgi:glycosyltransferase involved in cell wall biosynthesis
MNTPNPFFSVVIPTYNRSYCILDAISSVLNQSFVDFELLVIDDASTDNSDEIIYNIPDDRLKYYKNKENIGQSASLNRGVSLAKGNYVCFLDSDDLWEKEFLNSFHFRIFKSPKISCFYCWLNTEKGVYREWNLHGWIYKEALLNGELSSTITLVVLREVFLNVGGFDEALSYGNDDDLCFRLAKKYKFELLPLPLAISRTIDSNALTKQSFSLANGKKKLLEKYGNDISKYFGKNVISKKYFELSNNYLLAGDFTNYKLNLLIYLNLKFEKYPKFFQLIVFNLIQIYKFKHVRKSL